jgi:hypothetical protein
MAQMDHNEAIELQVAVKYVLGELSSPQRDEYEEHYFDCAECATDIRALVTFADTAREVLLQEKSAHLMAASAPASAAGWFRWFQPIVAIPAFAALLLIIAYQNTVTIPLARTGGSSSNAQLFVSSRAPKMVITRSGEDLPKYSVHPNDPLPLRFDFTPSSPAEAYDCQILDESGRSLLQMRVPGSFAKRELNLVIPANRLKPGHYSLVFTAAPDAKNQPAKAEVLRLSFVVEFLP